MRVEISFKDMGRTPDQQIVDALRNPAVDEIAVPGPALRVLAERYHTRVGADRPVRIVEIPEQAVVLLEPEPERADQEGAADGIGDGNGI